jgi:hypothetical protein
VPPSTESDPKARTLGYARVSTYGQTLDAQLENLRKERCPKFIAKRQVEPSQSGVSC